MHWRPVLLRCFILVWQLPSPGKSGGLNGSTQQVAVRDQYLTLLTQIAPWHRPERLRSVCFGTTEHLYCVCITRQSVKCSREWQTSKKPMYTERAESRYLKAAEFIDRCDAAFPLYPQAQLVRESKWLTFGHAFTATVAISGLRIKDSNGEIRFQ